MVRLLVLYNKPSDVDAFEKRFTEILVPLTKKMAGLRNYTVSRNIAPSLRGEAYYIVAELDWDDMAAMQEAFQSPEGKVAAVEAARVAELSPGTRSMTYQLAEV
jgi:uncharacterized protein (TIGR02118 family)